MVGSTGQGIPFTSFFSASLVKIAVLLLCYTCVESVQAMPQQYRIGLSVWSGYPENIEGFKSALEEGGITEENTEFVYRNAHGNHAEQERIALEFSKMNLDMVYSLTTPGTSIIKEVLPPSTPIVFSIVTYPDDAGLIESFEYSGNNLVGTSNYVPLTHYVDLLRRVLPKAKSIAIFRRTGEPNSTIQAKNLNRLLTRANYTVHDVHAVSVGDLALQAEIIAREVDVFLTTTDTLLQDGGEESLIEISRSMGVPILSSNMSGIKQGATFGPVADFYILGEISGRMASDILLTDQSPHELSSKLQTPPSILANRASLKQLKITIPSTMKNVKYVD